MHIREYPEIKKGNKTLAAKTNAHSVIDGFTEQMSERGLTCMTFFTDKNNKDCHVSGISYSTDFTPEDMMNIIVNYLNNSIDPRKRMLFVSQLQNYIVTQALNEEDDE